MRFLIGCYALIAATGASATMEPATPESQGVPSAAILEWLDACEKVYDAGKAGALHGFVIVRHGKVIAEGSWRPFDTLNETHMLYSHSKSFTSTAVGFLADEGKVDLDERIVDVFSNDVPASVSENLAQLRVRDLLTMNAGGKKDHLFRSGGDWVRIFLQQDFPSKPGTGFRYDSDSTYMLAALVEKRAGRPMMDYLRRKLFDRIGIEKAWTTCSPQGIPCGGWGMNMTTRELARFGQFYLQKGRWNGEQLLSSEWIALATARQTWCNGITIQAQTIGSGSDWKQGYGFQFWRCRHGAYRADGASGQYTVVMPEQDAVVSIHAGLRDMQTELNLIWIHLLPAMLSAPLPENDADRKRLADRLAKLEIRPVANCVGVDFPMPTGKTIELKDNSRGFRRVRLGVGTDAPWELMLETPVGEQRIPVGVGSWQKGTMRIDTVAYESLGAYVGEQTTAASGGVQQDGSVRVRVYLTGTPGHIDLSFAGDRLTGEFRAMGGCKLEAK